MKLIILAVFFAASANAAEYDLKYTTKDGRTISATEALLKAVNGETIYKCQTVENKVSKAGTSISLRNIKKPKND